MYPVNRSRIFVDRPQVHLGRTFSRLARFLNFVGEDAEVIRITTGGCRVA